MDNIIILSKDTFSFLQLESSSFYQNQEYELEIDNEAPSLSFLLNIRLYKIEKPD